MGRLKRISYVITIMPHHIFMAAPSKVDFSKFSKIMVVSTYDCYYHNVASFGREGGINLLLNMVPKIEYTVLQLY